MAQNETRPMPEMMKQMMEKMCGAGGLDPAARCQEMMREMLGKGGGTVPECCRQASTPAREATPDTKEAKDA